MGCSRSIARSISPIYINLLSGVQTVTIATSPCQEAVLVVPVITPQFAACAGVLGLLGLGFFHAAVGRAQLLAPLKDRRRFAFKP